MRPRVLSGGRLAFQAAGRPSIARHPAPAPERHGILYAVDRSTGRERWRVDVGEGAHFPGVAAAPTLVDGVVYFAAPGHTLVGVDAGSG